MNDKVFKIFEDKIVSSIIITNRENIGYLSGFWGSYGCLVLTKRSNMLITDFRYIEIAKEQAKGFEIIIQKDSLYKTIQEALRRADSAAIGYEDMSLTVNEYEKLKLALPNSQLIPIGNSIKAIRSVKTSREISIIKTAAEIADFAFGKILEVIRPGILEKDIAMEIELIMKNNGAQGISFETITVSGARSALPHGTPSDKALNFGDLLTIDFGCIYGHYCSDMTRTIGISHLGDREKEIYNIVLNAQQSTISVLKAGMIASNVDKIARDIISNAGYGDNFGHSLGHGVGINVHEEPTLSSSSEIVLESGMVVTIEPGIYITGLGGVRIEDLVVIKENGVVNLTSSLKDLIIV